MKHDHNKTKKLKVSLFAMIMFLPFIAIGVTSATHIFNKEVSEETETAEIEYTYTTNNPQEELIQNNVYLLNATLSYRDIVNNEDDNFSIEILKNSVEIDQSAQYDDSIIGDLYQIKEINIKIVVEYETITIIYNIDTDRDQYITYNAANRILTFNNTLVKITPRNNSRTSAIYTNLQELPNNLNPIANVNITTNPTDQTTNIFYDSCDQVKQSFILSWCGQQNPLRNTIQNFTNAVALPNDHIVNDLLTYWLSITLIYVVIDIIIELFIYITHFFNKEV